MRPDRPPGTGKRGRPRQGPRPAADRPVVTPPASSTDKLSVGPGTLNSAVLERLLDLRWRYGYLTRDEIDAELGLDRPHGRWECPGQFAADGSWAPCCRRDAA